MPVRVVVRVFRYLVPSEVSMQIIGSESEQGDLEDATANLESGALNFGISGVLDVGRESLVDEIKVRSGGITLFYDLFSQVMMKFLISRV